MLIRVDNLFKYQAKSLHDKKYNLKAKHSYTLYEKYKKVHKRFVKF